MSSLETKNEFVGFYQPKANAIHIGRVPCPECRKKGRDRSGDNMQLWKDGHGHCFSCGYHVRPPTLNTLHELSKKVPSGPELDLLVDQVEAALKPLSLPIDSTVNIALEASNWLSKYGITRQEVIDHDFKWSDARKSLIFPIYGKGYNLLAWQERHFGLIANKKYSSHGKIHDVLKFIFPKDKENSDFQNGIVVVEDLVSAIRVGRSIITMPLWGCALSKVTTLRLYQITKRVILWLDSNKYDEAMFFAKQLELLNVKTKVIYTQDDPKCYTDDEIRQFVYGE